MASHAKGAHRSAQREGGLFGVRRSCDPNTPPARQILQRRIANPPVFNENPPLHRVPALCTATGMPKCTVYILRSVRNPDRFYTGVTSNLRARLDEHNAGRCAPTARDRPWEVDVFVKFRDEGRALAFERYLKSGSGCAFAKRHFRG